MCDDTKNLNETESETFPIPNISDSFFDTKYFPIPNPILFRYQIFPIPNPMLFYIKKISDTESDTSFDTKYFQYRIRYFFDTKYFRSRNVPLCIIIISIMVTNFTMLQHTSNTWATGKMGGLLSLFFATFVTLVLFALGGIFIYISVDV